MATLKDVAQLAGVTVTTVSRMMNDRCRVSEKTRRLVEDAMAALDYHPNELARSLAKRSSGFIGLIVPSARNFFFSGVIECIEHYASASGLKLLLCVSNLDAKKEKEYFSMLLCNKVIGIILASHTQDLPAFEELGAPLITIDRTLSPRVPSACSDNYNGGVLAGEHLIAKGCRRLMYVSDSASLDMDANKRFQGFQDACARHGVPEPLVVRASKDQFISMRYEQTVARIFQEQPPPDGVFTTNDVIATKIVRYCLKNGVAIPEKLKLVGYDDTEIASLCTPALTTIHQPIDEISRYAVETILKASEGRVVPVSAVFPVALVERETT